MGLIYSLLVYLLSAASFVAATPNPATYSDLTPIEEPTNPALAVRATQSSSSTSTFNPKAAGIPSNYNNCIISPKDNNVQNVNLLSLTDGFTISNKNNVATTKTANTNKSITYNLIGKRSSVSWAYDLVSNDTSSPANILAIFKNGAVGFVQNSSYGQTFIKDNSTGKYYVTTLFGLTCGGEIVAGFANGPPVTFVEKKGLLYANNETSSSKDSVAGKTLRMLIYLNFGAPFPYDDPRCPKDDEKSVVKQGARPPGYNGCGSESLKVPDLWFVDCCNQHDLCYDDCSADFYQCNENFRSCNLQACQTNFPNTSQILERYGCQNLANTYADAVSSPLGEHVWETDDRCECKCKDDSLTLCNGECVNTMTDANNCGSCGNVCPSGTNCGNGTCDGRTNQCPDRASQPDCVPSCGAVTGGCQAESDCNTNNGKYGDCTCRVTMAGEPACVYSNFEFPCGYKYGGSGPYNGTGCYSDDDCDCYSKCIASDNCCGIGLCAYGAGCSPQTEALCINRKGKRGDLVGQKMFPGLGRF